MSNFVQSRSLPAVRRCASLALGIACGLAQVHAAAPTDDNSILHLPIHAGRDRVLTKRTPEHVTLPNPRVCQAEPAIRAKPGPWGDLEYSTVYLEASTEQLKSNELPTYDTEWTFVGYTDDQVTKLFVTTDMPELVRAELVDRTKWRHDKDAVTVVPPSNSASNT